MELIKSGHSVYKLSYHLVWTCKYRRRILKPGVIDYLRRILPKIERNIPGLQIEQIGFDQDHMHMVAVIPPKYSVSEVVAQMKSQSASMLRKRFEWLGKVYYKENIVWSPGYFVSSVGVSEEAVRKYVEYQGREDLGQLRLGL